MKMRLVRFIPYTTVPRYAILYADGTMISNLAFGRAKSDGNAENKKREAEAREKNRRVLRDMLMDFDNADKLSAVAYGSTERWDTDSDGNKMTNMALWGSNHTANEAIVTDDGKLCVLNEVLFALAAQKCSDVFDAVNTSVVESLPPKLRLVRFEKNIRSGLCLLYADGTMDSSISLDEKHPDDCKLVADILRNYNNADEMTSRTGERWDNGDDFAPLKDMSMWGLDGFDLLAVSGDNQLIVYDASVMQTVNFGVTDVPDVRKDAIKWVTAKQYVRIAAMQGLFNDKLREIGVDPKNVTFDTIDDNPEVSRILYVVQVHILSVMQKNRNGKFDIEDKGWRGYPFANDIDKAVQIQIPVLYPDDSDFKRNGGYNDEPVLPMYPVDIRDYSSYVPVRVSKEAMDWLVAETNANKGHQKRKNSKLSKQMDATSISDSKSIASRVIEYKQSGRTIDEVVDIIFAERESSSSSIAKSTVRTLKEKKAAIRTVVERIWNSKENN